MSFLLPQPMPQKSGCQLPSIRSLQLDLPVQLPPIQPQHSEPTPPPSFTAQDRSVSAILARPAPSGPSMLKPLLGSVTQPSMYTRTPPSSQGYQPDANLKQEPTDFKTSPSPIPHAQAYISPVSSPSLSDAPAKAESPVSEPEKRSRSWSDSNNDSAEEEGPTKWKPRKKRQCPECKMFFSNLATHKSTHLKPAARPHVCKYCSRGFARPNDLFRHIKCHWKETGSDKGQFKCPYKNHSSGDHCGHTSGIFSRCDTFKNHLKAIHFQYPTGTKKDQRNKSSGSCRMCHQSFSSVDDWLTSHIEKNSCPYANEYKKT